MADSKYADLPGIALDEPDVYETDDLPESDQITDFYEKENEVVEKIHVTPDQAFNRFKDKYLNKRNTDFSDKITSAIRTGYDAVSGDWELTAKGHEETPLQKYNRLQCEFNELIETVTALQTSSKKEVDSEITADQIKSALNKLTNLKLEETLGSDLLSKVNDSPSFLLMQLQSQLDQFKILSKEKIESQVQSNETGIVYQINYKPELSKLEQTGRIAELESRIHHLESLLGTSNEKLRRLSLASWKGSVLETVQHLASVANLLDSSQLDHIEGRLTALSEKLELISEKKKEIIPDTEKNEMILELYNLLKNNEHITKLLPETIERLKSLEELHNKAADLMKTLSEVEVLQTDISANLKDNKTLLKGVQESFANNLNEINESIIGVDNRIKALKAKKEKK